MKRFSVFGLLGILLGIHATSGEAAPRIELETPPAITSAMLIETAPPQPVPAPVLTRAAYEIHAYAGMAAGVLWQDFRNDTEEDLQVRFVSTTPPPIEVVSLALHDDEGRRDLSWETETVESRDGTTAPQPLRSNSFPLAAGDAVRVRTEVRLQLRFQEGLFLLTLPAVRGAGESVSSAPPGVKIQVTVHSPIPLREATSPSHDVIVDFEGDRTIIEPVQPEIPGDRPFVAGFKMGTPENPTLVGHVGPAEDGLRTVEAMLAPPEEPRLGTARPKQVLFVIDTSGSMAKENKLVQAREAVSQCFDKLRPEDRFNIIEFGAAQRAMSAQPVDPSSFGGDQLKSWLASLRANGGTKLLPGLETALSQPADPERHRILIVITDGMLQDEKEALELLEEKLGDGRLFVVGTGKRMRQETLLRLAEYGRGAATFAGRDSELGTAVAELFDSISDPLGWDLQFAFEGVQVEEISPTRLPDLYAGRPVRVMARVRGDLPSALEVRMVTLDGEKRYRVLMPPAN